MCGARQLPSLDNLRGVEFSRSSFNNVTMPSDGKEATAKNPRKWPRLFDFRAADQVRCLINSAMMVIAMIVPAL
jgi:hypothetical protein